MKEQKVQDPDRGGSPYRRCVCRPPAGRCRDERLPLRPVRAGCGRRRRKRAALPTTGRATRSGASAGAAARSLRATALRLPLPRPVLPQAPKRRRRLGRATGNAAIDRTNWPDRRLQSRRSPAGRQPEDMPVFAALDLGTNNCRLLVAVPTRPGQFRVVDAFSRIVGWARGCRRAAGSASRPWTAPSRR